VAARKKRSMTLLPKEKKDGGLPNMARDQIRKNLASGRNRRKQQGESVLEGQKAETRSRDRGGACTAWNSRPEVDVDKTKLVKLQDLKRRGLKKEIRHKRISVP